MFSQSFKRFLSETSTRALYLQRPNFKVISQHWHFTLMYHIWSFSRHYYFCMIFDLEKECLLSPLWRVYKGFFIFQSFSSTLVLSSWWSSIHLLEMKSFLLGNPLVIHQNSTKKFPSPEGGLRIIRKTEPEENDEVLKNPLYTLHKGPKRHNICRILFWNWNSHKNDSSLLLSIRHDNKLWLLIFGDKCLYSGWW